MTTRTSSMFEVTGNWYTVDLRLEVAHDVEPEQEYLLGKVLHGKLGDDGWCQVSTKKEYTHTSLSIGVLVRENDSFEAVSRGVGVVRWALRACGFNWGPAVRLVNASAGDGGVDDEPTTKALVVVR